MKERLMAMILLCVMAFGLVACGGSSGSSGGSAFAGKWTIESMSAEGMEFGKEMLDSLGMGDWSLEITEDGKVTANMMGESHTSEGKIDGNKLSITEDGMTMDMIIEGGKLVWDMGEDGKVTFTK